MHGRSNTGRGDSSGNRSGGGHHNHNRNAGQHSSSGSSSNSGGNQRRNPRVHTFDSNGPDVRIRGNAYQINEKYVTLARDANSAGDRVLAESYLQHAEHYQRLINEMTEEFGQQHYSQPQQPQQSQQQQPQQEQHSQQVQPHSSQDYSQQPQPAQPSHQQPRHQHSQPQQHRRVAETVQPAVEESETDGLNDLDQSFLVGPRRGLPPRETQQPVVAQRPRRQAAAAPVERPKSNGHAVEEPVAEGQSMGEQVDTEMAAAAPVRQPRPRYPRPQKEPDAV
jgi:hypothetical protein